MASLFWLFSIPGYALACSCDLDLKVLGKSEKDQIKIARKKAVAVFSGKVLDITYDEKHRFYYARFRVENSWKNVADEEVVVSGLTMCCLCDWIFEVGKSYLIYAGKYDSIENSYRVSHCSRSQLLHDSEMDLKVLGEGKNGQGTKVEPSPRSKNLVP